MLFLLARSTADNLQKQVEYLKAENEMLEEGAQESASSSRPMNGRSS